MPGRLLIAVALVPVVVATTARAAEPVNPVIERLGSWVQQFENDFITVIADETYDQFTSRRSTNGREHRRIASELLFMRGGTPPEWLAVRNVLSFTDEGRATVEIAKSRDRLKEALESEGGGRAALRRLADESARFNIGRVGRNFNTPTLVLQFLDDRHRDRFKFKLSGAETVGGEQAWRVRYEERSHPTIIKANDLDTDLSGMIWARQSDGAVLRTRMELKAPPRGIYSGINSTVTVEYLMDSKLRRIVPSRMEEHYIERDGDQRIEGTATYSNYRVFETSGKLITP